MLDIHCHILPGVDDGAQNLREAERMLAQAKRCGIQTMVATPHVLEPEQDLSGIHRAFEQVRPLAEKRGIRLLQGYEVNWRALAGQPFSALARYCIEGTDHLLLEFPYGTPPPRWEFIISELCGLYRPIIAHPERFDYVQRDVRTVSQMIGLGCEIQLDAQGLFAGIFSKEQKTARTLLQRGMCHYIASDAHDAAGYRSYEKARKYGTLLQQGAFPRTFDVDGSV